MGFFKGKYISCQLYCQSFKLRTYYEKGTCIYLVNRVNYDILYFIYFMCDVIK